MFASAYQATLGTDDCRKVLNYRTEKQSRLLSKQNVFLGYKNTEKTIKTESCKVTLNELIYFIVH